MLGYTAIREKVAAAIKPSRFLHSQGVSDTAAYLAERFGLRTEDARITGIYHDAYRYDGCDSALSELEEAGIPVFPEEVENPMLLHGALAALHFDEDAEGKVPEAWKKAVRHHTLGSREMGKLGAVIYIADYIEPGRKHLTDQNRTEILEEKSLEDMILHIMDMQRPYLEREGLKEAEVSKELYAFLKKGGTL